MNTKMAGFDTFKDLYARDNLLGKIFMEATEGKHDSFILHDDFLFNGLQLSILDCSLREHIIQELYGVGHFGQDKTLACRC